MTFLRFALRQCILNFWRNLVEISVYLKIIFTSHTQEVLFTIQFRYHLILLLIIILWVIPGYTWAVAVKCYLYRPAATATVHACPVQAEYLHSTGHFLKVSNTHIKSRTKRATWGWMKKLWEKISKYMGFEDVIASLMLLWVVLWRSNFKSTLLFHIATNFRLWNEVCHNICKTWRTTFYENILKLIFRKRQIS